MPRITFTILSLMCSTVARGVTLHVAPAGDDTRSGTVDQPLASLTGARDAIRKMKAAGEIKEPVTVLVAPGRYPISETFVLTPDDSGTPAAPITYQAASAGVAEGDRPVFSGGRRI